MRKKTKPVSFSAGNTTLIAGGTHVVGDIHFSGNLEVEGQVTGNIVAEEDASARVRILPEGRITGDIRVPHGSEVIHDVAIIRYVVTIVIVRRLIYWV